MFRKRKKRGPVVFEAAPDIRKTVNQIVKNLDLGHLTIEQIYCIRSTGSVARAYARIWGLSRIFQIAAGFKPVYVIEVLSRHFDPLSEREKIKVLIHELMHIPKTFSGALLSHHGRFHRINKREVEKWYKKWEENTIKVEK